MSTIGVSYRSVLRQPDVGWIWGSQALSVFGDRVFTLAIMWLVWSATGSPLLMGVVAIAESVPFILVGVFGRRLMRWSRTLRQLAVIDLVRAGIVALMPLVFSSTPSGIAGLLVLVFLLGVATSLFDPSLMSKLPDVAGDESRVTAIYGLFDLSARVVRVAGPLIAGLLLVVVTNQQLLWINAATFLVSAFALSVVARRHREDPVVPALPKQAPAEAERVRVKLLPELKWTFTIHGAMTFAFGAIIALPAMLAALAGQEDPTTYGFAMDAYGLGAVALNPVAARVVPKAPFPLIYCAGAALFGSGLLTVALVPVAPLVVAAMFVVGAATPFTGISLLTFIARAYSDNLRRSVLTTDQTIIRTTGTIGVVAFPLLASISPALTFGLGGALVVLTSAGALLFSRKRQSGAAQRPHSTLETD